MHIRHVFLAFLLVPLLLSSACDRSKEDSKISADALAQRAQEIHDEILQKLQTSYPAEQGSLWTDSKIQLEDDWIVQGPDRIWGATADQLPDALDCNTQDADCDKVFKRQLCEVDSDCRTVSTQCVPLQASVHVLGQSPSSMCLGMGDALMDRFYNVVVSADHELDIVSLSVPSGRFYTVMINALSILSQKSSVPSIRMLFSGNVAGFPILNSTDSIMKQIAQDVKILAPNTHQKLLMNLAWLSKGISWNHTKIVVTDGTRALQGGHNFWDAQYLAPRTIFDLSMEYRGEGAARARDFVNVLWNEVGSKFSDSPKGLGRITNFVSPSSTEGTIDTISVARMGAFGKNVSEVGLQYLIDSAKTNLSLIQQDVYNFFILPSPLFRTFAFDNIVNAAARGVQVNVVLSNQQAFQGYKTVNGEAEYKTFLDALVAKLQKEQKMTKAEAQKTACERLTFVPFRFSRHIAYWPSKKDEQPGLHTKFVMVDDAAFYIGSHNFYPADLQEFGNIVTDAKATSEIKAQYWDKVWEESLAVKMACPY